MNRIWFIEKILRIIRHVALKKKPPSHPTLTLYLQSQSVTKSENIKV